MSEKEIREKLYHFLETEVREHWINDQLWSTFLVIASAKGFGIERLVGDIKVNLENGMSFEYQMDVFRELLGIRKF